MSCGDVKKCSLYNAIKVAVPVDGEAIVKVRGEVVTSLPPWEVAVFVQGLHAGMHLEQKEWSQGGAMAE